MAYDFSSIMQGVGAEDQEPGKVNIFGGGAGGQQAEGGAVQQDQQESSGSLAVGSGLGLTGQSAGTQPKVGEAPAQGALYQRWKGTEVKAPTSLETAGKEIGAAQTGLETAATEYGKTQTGGGGITQEQVHSGIWGGDDSGFSQLADYFVGAGGQPGEFKAPEQKIVGAQQRFGTEAGIAGELTGQFGQQGQYTPGMASLDAYLLSKSPQFQEQAKKVAEAEKGYGETYAKLTGGIGQEGSAEQQAAEKIGKERTAAQQTILDLVQKEQNKLLGDIRSRELAEEERRRGYADTALTQAMGQLSPDELAWIMSGGQRPDIAPFINAGPTDLVDYSGATQDEMRAWNNIMALLGAGGIDIGQSPVVSGENYLPEPTFDMEGYLAALRAGRAAAPTPMPAQMPGTIDIGPIDFSKIGVGAPDFGGLGGPIVTPAPLPSVAEAESGYTGSLLLPSVEYPMRGLGGGMNYGQPGMGGIDMGGGAVRDSGGSPMVTDNWTRNLLAGILGIGGGGRGDDELPEGEGYTGALNLPGYERPRVIPHPAEPITGINPMPYGYY